MKFPYAKTFLLGFGFFGISLIWPIFNNFVPVFLKEEFFLTATVIGFIMTWDNYINMFVQPIVGERSDRTRSRFGRRKPWILIGAPLAAIFFITVPLMKSVPGIMIAILLTNICMALFRSPTVALLGDIFPAKQRSTANGIINLMGGVGAILAFLVGGLLFERFGKVAPFVFGSVVMLIAMVIIFIFLREPPVPEEIVEQEKTGGFLTHLREVINATDRSGLFILLAILCWFMGYNALETWISSFGKFSLEISEGRMSIFSSLLALTFVVSALPSGLIATRFGRRRVILVGIIGLGVLFLFGLVISSQLMLIVFLVLAGFFWALINVNSLPMVYDIGGNARIGVFTGLYYLASNLAAVIGPQTVGILIDVTTENYRVMFAFSFVFMALAAVCMSRVRERKPPVNGES